MQDNRVQVAALRDAFVAGGDFHVQDLHVHVEDSGGDLPGKSSSGIASAPAMPTAPRSSYLQQVRRIAPPDPPGLKDREDELAELTRFCLDPDGPAYAWWRAKAWAGKSALMSTFVLRPPPLVAEQVRIVSFFITARLAAQDNREAFTVVLLEQLAELTGQTLPSALPEATREGYLLDLLAEAAGVCQQAGGRLVLVIDGLDEDRGVIAGPHAHSIAGLLPSEPPSGMKVIVAGRPNPPVPDDVPDWHPLRDPAIVRQLPDSPHARDIQRLGRQELHRLLSGSEHGRDLLGLLTAARGGLSGPDLAELSGVPLWETEEILHTVAGRTFTRRASRWAPATGPEVYLLGHEELQAAAERYLGDRLAGYRDRLHEWADTYRKSGWPPETPEYLLSGYYGLLSATCDLPRMAVCATDAARHDRMLEVTGGDTAGLTEARAALDRITAKDSPDLVRALAVARHRDQLNDRNSNIPVVLPAVWAALGQATRAEALAGSIADPYRQTLALTWVADELARTGQHEHAAAITAQAEATARSILDPRSLAEALAKLAGLLTKTGQDKHAATIAEQAGMAARAYTEPTLQVTAMTHTAEMLAKAGQRQHVDAIAGQAETAARSVTVTWSQARALAQAAEALTGSGHSDKAAAITAEAEALARTVTEPHERVQALVATAASLDKAGCREKAAALAAEAEVLARTVTEPHKQASALADAAEGLARAGQYQLAEGVARAIADPRRQAYCLGDVTKMLAEAGEYQHAEAIARAITDPWPQAEAMVSVAKALANAGMHQRAEVIAHTITKPRQQAEALAEVAYALSEDGQTEDASKTAVQAEAAARSIEDLQGRTFALTSVAFALTGIGHYEQAAVVVGHAEAIARVIDDPEQQVGALVWVAEAIAESKGHDQAAAFAEWALAATRSHPDPWNKMSDLMRIAKILAEAGEYEHAAEAAGQAVAAAHSITDPGSLGAVAWMLADIGRYQEAQVIAASITAPEEQPGVLGAIAGALAEAGEHDQAAAIAAQAEAVARSVSSPSARVFALAQAAISLVSIYQEQATTLAREAESLTRTLPGSRLENSEFLFTTARSLIATGQYGEAEATARAISTDSQGMRDVARLLVAEALAKAQQYAKAEEVARAILNPRCRAEPLARIAKKLAESGEAEDACRLTVEACAAGRWLDVVAPVLLLDSSAPEEVMHMLRSH